MNPPNPWFSPCCSSSAPPNMEMINIDRPLWPLRDRVFRGVDMHAGNLPGREGRGERESGASLGSKFQSRIHDCIRYNEGRPSFSSSFLTLRPPRIRRPGATGSYGTARGFQPLPARGTSPASTGTPPSPPPSLQSCARLSHWKGPPPVGGSGQLVGIAIDALHPTHGSEVERCGLG